MGCGLQRYAAVTTTGDDEDDDTKKDVTDAPAPFSSGILVPIGSMDELTETEISLFGGTEMSVRDAYWLAKSYSTLRISPDRKWLVLPGLRLPVKLVRAIHALPWVPSDELAALLPQPQPHCAWFIVVHLKKTVFGTDHCWRPVLTTGGENVGCYFVGRPMRNDYYSALLDFLYSSDDALVETRQRAHDVGAIVPVPFRPWRCTSDGRIEYMEIPASSSSPPPSDVPTEPTLQ